MCEITCVWRPNPEDVVKILKKRPGHFVASGAIIFDGETISTYRFVHGEEQVEINEKEIEWAIIHNRVPTQGTHFKECNNHPFVMKTITAVHRGEVNGIYRHCKEKGMEIETDSVQICALIDDCVNAMCGEINTDKLQEIIDAMMELSNIEMTGNVVFVIHDYPKRIWTFDGELVSEVSRENNAFESTIPMEENMQ